MGYAILTQEELNNVDLNNVKIDGKLIGCVPRPNVLGTLFIIQGDMFLEYTRESILQYINDNWSDWNAPVG